MLRILQGDAIERLRELQTESVHCCVTSPPYWGLRDYGTAEWEGGDSDCDHVAQQPTLQGGRALFPNKGDLGGGLSSWTTRPASSIFFQNCGKCGAKRIDSQLGLEKTPDEYVAKMVEIFREVRRVLRKDGTLWLNLGDSYANAQPRGFYGDQADNSNGSHGELIPARDWSAWKLKPKDLAGMPWRLAFALQADGWYLRSDIIWSKPNPMPESVTDRPTKAHEYLFLLSKSANYFYDNEAIREPQKEFIEYAKGPRASVVNGDSMHGGFAHKEGGFNATREARGIAYNPAGRNKRSVWTVATAPYPEAHFATYPPDLVKPCILAGTSARGCCAKCGAPWERIVDNNQGGKISFNEWRMQTDQTHWKDRGHSQKPGAQAKGGSTMQIYYREVFGSESPPPKTTTGWQFTCECNLSGGRNTGKGSNTKCGVKKSGMGTDQCTNPSPAQYHNYAETNLSHSKELRQERDTSEGGESPTCCGLKNRHEESALAQIIPCTVLDPFAGSGTTGAVALELGRKAILIELNPKYVELIEQRCNVTLGLALA